MNLLEYRNRDPAETGRPPDPRPHIAGRGYDFYQRRGRYEGQAIQDHATASGEIRKEALRKQVIR